MTTSTTPRTTFHHGPMSPRRRPVSAASRTERGEAQRQPEPRTPARAARRASARWPSPPTVATTSGTAARTHGLAEEIDAAEEHQQQRHQRRRRRGVLGQPREQLLHQSSALLLQGLVELLGREVAHVAEHLLALGVEHDLRRHDHDLEALRPRPGAAGSRSCASWPSPPSATWRSCRTGCICMHGMQCSPPNSTISHVPPSSAASSSAGAERPHGGARRGVAAESESGALASAWRPQAAAGAQRERFRRLIGSVLSVRTGC